jgi:hypothetical protein
MDLTLGRVLLTLHQCALAAIPPPCSWTSPFPADPLCVVVCLPRASVWPLRCTFPPSSSADATICLLVFCYFSIVFLMYFRSLLFLFFCYFCVVWVIVSLILNMFSRRNIHLVFVGFISWRISMQFITLLNIMDHETTMSAHRSILAKILFAKSTLWMSSCHHCNIFMAQ